MNSESYWVYFIKTRYIHKLSTYTTIQDKRCNSLVSEYTRQYTTKHAIRWCHNTHDNTRQKMQFVGVTIHTNESKYTLEIHSAIHLRLIGKNVEKLSLQQAPLADTCHSNKHLWQVLKKLIHTRNPKTFKNDRQLLLRMGKHSTSSAQSTRKLRKLLNSIIAQTGGHISNYNNKPTLVLIYSYTCTYIPVFPLHIHDIYSCHVLILHLVYIYIMFIKYTNYWFSISLKYIWILNCRRHFPPSQSPSERHLEARKSWIHLFHNLINITYCTTWSNCFSNTSFRVATSVINIGTDSVYEDVIHPITWY